MFSQEQIKGFLLKNLKSLAAHESGLLSFSFILVFFNYNLLEKGVFIIEKITQVFLIRHSEQLKIKNESSQILNEKIILSVEGERKAEEISKLRELSNIDVLYSSNYVRAISTAKYIASQNNIEINIDENLNERKLGDLEALEKLGQNMHHTFTVEQLLDETLKNKDGESRTEVVKRMEELLNNILTENLGKNIAIVSHGASIKFILMNWCNLNNNYELEYNSSIINVNSPSVIKLVFDNKKLVGLSQIF